jgi:hypothetical protein
MRFILLEKLRQEITQKRNQLLLLLSSFPNYYKPFRGFEDLMSMVFNIFWSLVLLLSNFVFFFSSLIEDLQFDFNLITNIFLDSVLFLGTIIMLISMMISTLISLPMNLLWSHSVTENTEIPGQSYTQILKNLFVKEPINTSKNSIKIDDITRHRTAQESLLRLFEREESDRDAVALKISEFKDEISRLHAELIKNKTFSISYQQDYFFVEQGKVQLPYMEYYRSYEEARKTYPRVDDFSKLTTEELEEFESRFEEHHIQTIEIGSMLIQEMNSVLKELYDKYHMIYPVMHQVEPSRNSLS